MIDRCCMSCEQSFNQNVSGTQQDFSKNVFIYIYSLFVSFILLFAVRVLNKPDMCYK